MFSLSLTPIHKISTLILSVLGVFDLRFPNPNNDRANRLAIEA